MADRRDGRQLAHAPVALALFVAVAAVVWVLTWWAPALLALLVLLIADEFFCEWVNRR